MEKRNYNVLAAVLDHNTKKKKKRKIIIPGRIRDSASLSIGLVHLIIIVRSSLGSHLNYKRLKSTEA